MLTLGSQHPQINATSYTSPFLSAVATTTPALNLGTTGGITTGITDLLDTKDLLYNSLSSDVLFDASAAVPAATTGLTTGSNVVDMLEIPGNSIAFQTQFRHFTVLYKPP